MVSDERRRYDAQKLREEGFAEGLGDDHGIIDSPEDAGELMLRVLDVICDYRDGMHYYPDFFEGKAVVEFLAELIDRPACNNVSEFGRNTAVNFDFVCSHCGSRLISDGMYCSPLVDDRFSHYGIKFCPNCGAEVVK